MTRKLVNAQIECNFSRAAAQRSFAAQFPRFKFQVSTFCLKPFEAFTLSSFEADDEPIFFDIALPTQFPQRMTQGRGHGVPTMVLA